MARRIHLEQATSRLALWARRIALFSLATTVLSIVILHAGVLEIRPGLATFGAALALALVALILAFAAFVSIWNTGLHGIGAALTAVAIAGLLLAYPAYLISKAGSLPWIADITTDPIDPPRYDALAKVRPRDANPIDYAGLTAAEQQFEAYPDIQPLDADIDTRLAYKAALTVIGRRRWQVVEARAPDERGLAEGRIEAVARTPVMGFRDDVIVRVRAFEGGARVDVRSSSRYGGFDFGANATRVRRLLADIDVELGRQAPEEPVIPRRPIAKETPKTTPKTTPKPAPKAAHPKAAKKGQPASR